MKKRRRKEKQEEEAVMVAMVVVAVMEVVVVKRYALMPSATERAAFHAAYKGRASRSIEGVVNGKFSVRGRLYPAG